VLYKLSDNLTQALTRPFLVQIGFDATDVGVVTGTISLAATLVGTFLGGLLTNSLGLGRALWVFGFFQIFSNLGYALVAQVGPNKAVMYGAVAFELGSTGLGSGAFGVLLLRLTQKRFSATQFALLSSLFSISRVLAGPPAGLLADAIGWRDFFILTIFTGIPGMLMLHRFVPWGVREPEFHAAGTVRGAPLARAELVTKTAFAAVSASVVGVLTMASLWGIRSYRARQGFHFLHQVEQVLAPRTLGAWTTLVGILVMGLMIALMTAATLVARRGFGLPAPPDHPE
jgi:PAT family beta-lactamase induction signal transducer AmpG